MKISKLPKIDNIFAIDYYIDLILLIGSSLVFGWILNALIDKKVSLLVGIIFAILTGIASFIFYKMHIARFSLYTLLMKVSSEKSVYENEKLKAEINKLNAETELIKSKIKKRK